MELNDYLKITKRYWVFILAFALAGAVLGFLFSQKLPSGTKIDQYFYVTAQTNDLTDASANARNFTDSAIAILTSPDFAEDLVSKNEYLSARKIAPQVIRITAITPSPDESKALIEKTTATFNQKILNLDTTSEYQIQPIDKTPPPTSTRLSAKLLTAAGVVVSAIFSLLIIGLKTYFRL